MAEKNAGDHHARLHALAGRAAGHVRPSPARLRRDVFARQPSACVDLPQAREPSAARRGGARRHELSDRPSRGGEDARLRRHLREFARCGVRPRFRDRIHGGGGARDDARVALLRRTRAVDEPARRLHRSGRPLLHRFVDHAAEEESGRARTRARQDRPRERPSDGAAHADEGPAARVQQGQSGRQGTAVRHGRYGRRHAAHLRGDGGGHHGEAATRCARPRCKASRRRPISPTIW